MTSDITQVNRTNFYPQNERQWDANRKLTVQLSNMILQTPEADQPKSAEFVIDHFLALLGGDIEHPLNALAKLILLKLPQAKESDVALTRKTLIEGQFLLQFPIPKKTIYFDVTSYNEMEKGIKDEIFNHLDEYKVQLDEAISKKQSEIFSMICILYKKLIIKIENTLNEIPLQTNKIEVALKDLISLNDKWTQYFEDLFTEIVVEHDFLADKKNYGYETRFTLYAPTSWNQYGSQLKIPNRKNISGTYLTTDIPFADVQKYDHTNFTTLFIDYPKWIEKIEPFARQAFAHLSDTSGTQHAMIPSSPNCDEMKVKANVLYGEYKNLHDECLHIFNNLNSMTDQLKRLQTHMTEHWTKIQTDLKEAKEEIPKILDRSLAELLAQPQSPHEFTIL